MAATINNDQDVIDSRDIIKRLEELESERQALVDATEDENTDQSTAQTDLESWDEDNYKELKALRALADEGENCSDWNHGATLIREDHFVDYIEQLIKDCYEMPKQMNSGQWPYCHLTMDWEAAAEAVKPDYMNVDFDGETYLISD